MATGTAGDTGHRKLPGIKQTIARRVLYSDWAGTNNDRHVWGVLPAYALVTAGGTKVITGFNDTTGDDFDIGVSGDDDDLFASAVDVNSAATTAFDDLATANDFSTSARKLTINFTTAPTGDGSTGSAIVWIEYVLTPSSGSTV